MHIILLLFGLVVILCTSSCCFLDRCFSYAYYFAAVWVGGHLMHIILLLLGLVGVGGCVCCWWSVVVYGTGSLKEAAFGKH